MKNTEKYNDDEEYRKEIYLKGKTIKGLYKAADLENRKLKNFLEVKLTEIAENATKKLNS